MKLADFRILTFDTYGTLIDWESGIHTALAPLLARRSPTPSRDEALEAFGREELRLQTENPGMLYRDVLSAVYGAIAQAWSLDAPDDEARAFGRSVKHWPAFDDAAESLAYLSQHYLMATLTNCDRVSYMGSNAKLEIEWDGLYTAQDVGAYKPSPRNFDYLLKRVRRDFGVLPHQILHVAQSLTHDMAPATRAGLTKVWINRRHGQEGLGATAPPQGPYTIEREYTSMDDFAAAHRAEIGA